MKTIQRFILNTKGRYLLLVVFFAISFYSKADQLMYFPLTSTTQLNSSGGLQSGTLSTNASGAVYDASKLYTTNWDSGSGAYKYYETSAISTAGYYNIVVSASLYSQSNGPRDIQLQYKIGSGSWTAVSNFRLTNTATNYSGTLPDECNNKAEVYIRYIATSYLNLSGGAVSASGRNYIYAVSIVGDLPAVPNTQAHTIRFVAITPTTIRVSCTPGNGDHRIIVMNTSNSFTLPVDDYNPAANTTYSTGEQVIYNGTGSFVTVTVPSASNNYYFRIFDYKYNGGMIRYVTDEAYQNPRLCALENITINPVTNIRLTRARFNATISPKKSDISDRGFVWSLTSGSNFSFANEYSETGTTDGSFSLNFPDDNLGTSDLPRGSTIYVKAYVDNVAGRIYSSEYTFSNVPVFSGTGNWEDATKWNVQEVPGANGDASYGSVEDSPIINGACTLTADNEVTNLTINSGRKLTINPATQMKIDGVLTNNTGTNGILIKASPSAANGSLILANGTTLASVEMYSKAYWNLANPVGSKYAWQYFGIPVTSLAYSSNFTSAYVRAWDESVTNYDNIWYKKNDGTLLMLSSGSTLYPNVAYELVQAGNKTYTFAGTLNTTDFSKSLDYSPGAYYIGQNMLSNPYVAAMNIENIEFGVNTEASVYQYNTGTYNDWLDSHGESTPGSGPGTYTVTTKEAAGLVGTLTQIPPMQGFLVKATGVGGSVSYSYSNLAKNTTMQRANKANQKVGSMIDLIGSRFSDRMWFLVDDNCSPAFENGYDGRKFLGLSGASQLYGVGSDDIYQICALKDINGAVIAVVPGQDSVFTIKFIHQNMDTRFPKLYLVDLVTNLVTDITQSGSEYKFTSTSTDPVNRFRITTTTTGIKPASSNDLFKIYQKGERLVVENSTNENGMLSVYDVSGKLLITKKIDSNTQTLIDEKLNKGSYVTKIVSENNQITKCIIIK